MLALHRRHRTSIRTCLVLAFALTMLPAGSVVAQSENPGLVDDTHYASPQFGYSLSWQKPWRVAAGTIVSSPGSNDQIGLERDLASAQIVLFVASSGFDETFDQVVLGIQFGGSDVQEIAKDAGEGFRTATLDLTANWRGAERRIRRYVELVDLTASNAGSPLFFLGTIGAPVDKFGESWASFTANVHQDGSNPVFRGTPNLSPATPVSTSGDSGDIPPGVKTYNYVGAQHDDNYHDWPEVPPVGGIHNMVWQKCQFYDKPINPGMGVHSLEHGAVWITYAPDLPNDQIDKIKAIANGQDYVLASPYPGLPAPIVLSSWNHQLQMQAYDQATIDQFIKVFKNSRKYTPEYGANCATGSTDTI